MKPVADSKELMKGAMILTMAALVTKILSAVYRVPFQNIVGDIGFYIYQQVYPFFGIVMVLSTYGFPVVISKLYTEQQAAGNTGRADRLLAISLVFLSMVGLLFFLFFYFGSGWIAEKIGDPELKPLFKVVSVPFLIFPFTSVFRGYFQGKGNMVPTAISQVSEQFIRVATILILSAVLVQQGFSLYITGAGAVFGSITGGVISVLILGFFYLKNRGANPFTRFHIRVLFKDAAWVLKALIIQGFAISISGMLLILLQLADSLNMYASLLATGLTAEEAKSAKGIFDRGQPLIQLGTVVATSMSLSLVPAISGDKSSNRREKVLPKVRLALQTSLIFGAAAAVGLYSIIVPANIMLFENADGSDVLGLLSLMILFGSVILTIMSILQGLDKSIFPAAVILAGFGLKYILNLLLIPIAGTMGAAIATLAAMLAVMFILIYKLRRELGQPVLSLVFIAKILFASAMMAVFLRLFLYITDFGYGYIEPDRLGAVFQALSSVAVGALVYFFILIKTRALTEEELVTLPFGSRIVQLFSK
ncbi:putative polysaccharide biosynthesis protein [Mesobacillus selenatarsenatis]|uniref:Stage V sporulation protein n=1 Tax=Mesobacillus selenatarsenatis (strain DSM 18680 / JCM 14380 / FERM P-15431 / SF-1) TaxID=1321606 RepID=A0A0A8WWI1_MESS1|nr:polysaccharide biosynthesis protein [Mesobacillus selenatarsenatis]GAM11943.1 stage V sporulation protein [Mesobacillus selenatarsenatis SF-1]